MELLLTVLVALQASMTSFAIPLRPSGNSSAPPGSLEHFLATTAQQERHSGPQGFFVQFGRNFTVEAGQNVPLHNYQVGEIEKDVFTSGTPIFETYSGLMCPAVKGFYYVSATVHFNASISSSNARDGGASSDHVTPLVQVTICHNSSCSDPNVASLDAYSSTSGKQTLTVSGLMSLKPGDALVVRVKTNQYTTADVASRSNYAAFLWGRPTSS